MLEGEDGRVRWQEIKKRVIPLFDLRPSTFDLISYRQYLALLNPFNGSLQRGVEGSEAFEVLAEELGADGKLVARGPDVDDSAADGIIAFLLDLGTAVIAEFRKAFGEL